MTMSDILSLVKVDLGIILPESTSSAVSDMEMALQNKIDSAIQFIRDEGITLVPIGEDFSEAEAELITMYASYLYRKRATDSPMPRMLRYALNNTLMKQKAGQANDS
ncbi:MAG: hypothetical protein MJY95_08405 [Bacteroidaceae bacterium]|nr:hypothetical protein [Bacteroidaceae bacterium]